MFERAVSDWHITTVLRRSGNDEVSRKNDLSPDKNAADRKKIKILNAQSCLASSPSSVASAGECMEHPQIPARATTRRRHHSPRKQKQHSSSYTERRFHRTMTEEQFDEMPVVDVVRVYQEPKDSADKKAGGRWRWELCLTTGARHRSDAEELLRLTGLENLIQSLEGSLDPGHITKVLLCAAARLFNTLFLTRVLAAKQCAEVRHELAMACARSASDASKAVQMRLACRNADRRNRRLILHLVDAKLPRWLSSFGNELHRRVSPSVRNHSVAAGTNDRVEMHSSADSTQDDGNDRISATSTDCSSLCHSTKSTEVKLRSCSDDEALNWDGASDDMDDSGQIRTERTRTCWRSSIFNKARCCGDQSADLPVKPRERVLKLSRVGLDNDTLNKVVFRGVARANLRLSRGVVPTSSIRADFSLRSQSYWETIAWCSQIADVVRRVMRYICRKGKSRETFLSSGGDDFSICGDTRMHQQPSSLLRLDLRENRITDAGVLSLCLLVENVKTLSTIDLRGNMVGRQGTATLQQALSKIRVVQNVSVEECQGGHNQKREGLILYARRHVPSTSLERAKACAFARIPRSRSGRSQLIPSSTNLLIPSANASGTKLNEGDTCCKDNPGMDLLGSQVYAAAFEASRSPTNKNNPLERSNQQEVLDSEALSASICCTKFGAGLVPCEVAIDLRNCSSKGMLAALRREHVMNQDRPTNSRWNHPGRFHVPSSDVHNLSKASRLGRQGVHDINDDSIVPICVSAGSLGHEGHCRRDVVKLPFCRLNGFASSLKKRGSLSRKKRRRLARGKLASKFTRLPHHSDQMCLKKEHEELRFLLHVSQSILDGELIMFPAHDQNSMLASGRYVGADNGIVTSGNECTHLSRVNSSSEMETHDARAASSTSERSHNRGDDGIHLRPLAVSPRPVFTGDFRTVTSDAPRPSSCPLGMDERSLHQQNIPSTKHQMSAKKSGREVQPHPDERLLSSSDYLGVCYFTAGQDNDFDTLDQVDGTWLNNKRMASWYHKKDRECELAGQNITLHAQVVGDRGQQRTQCGQILNEHSESRPTPYLQPEFSENSPSTTDNSSILHAGNTSKGDLSRWDDGIHGHGQGSQPQRRKSLENCNVGNSSSEKSLRFGHALYRSQPQTSSSQRQGKSRAFKAGESMMGKNQLISAHVQTTGEMGSDVPDISCRNEPGSRIAERTRALQMTSQGDEENVRQH